ncbi:MAG: S9 family peptidase, partial [Muribaculaceae bacterium]|nr:S9 family peptidase [Muribaculaceae bacterium]
LKPLSAEHTRQQAPVMSPDGRMVAYMADDNNIYISKLDYGTETPATTDGDVNRIINGVPDWVYQEEFSTYRSMEWAPDNSALSYLKYDETDVPAYTFSLYQGACDPKDQYALYPGQFTYKYPVAGEKNSVVSIHTYDIENRKTKSVTLPDASIEYIPRIHYGPTADVLIVTTLNRDQNRMELYSVNPKSTVSRSIYTDTSKAWILPRCYDGIAYEPQSMVLFSDRTGFSHLYRVSYSGQDLGTLTAGNYDVTAYYGATPDGGFYYQSASSGPLQRVITRVDRKGNAVDVSPAGGWTSATFAPAMNYYVINHSDANTPPVYTLINAKDKPVRVLEDNAAYAARYSGIPTKEFFTIESDGTTLNGWLIKPVDFNPSRRYPVIVYQYSGPGSQEVTDRWSMDWQRFAAMKGYVVACVDGRGTGARGREFEQIVYKRLGHYETIDQLALLGWLKRQQWVKADAIGINGWSFGGYETLMSASAPGAGYSAAVAIAAVTSWRFYDTIYAERYMSTPRQNPLGYEQSAPLSRVEGMRCPLLIMTGTADDNVHQANTLEYVSAMEQLGRWPEMLMFPNMNHSINGCDARAVVYARMLTHFNRYLLSK